MQETGCTELRKPEIWTTDPNTFETIRRKQSRLNK
jgi:hypothetical protein